jgi:hypothetical protein
MRRTPARSRSARIAVAGIASLALFGLTACGGDSDSDDASDTSSESPSPSESASESPSEEPTESEEAGTEPAGAQPEWANPVTTPGEKLTTIEVGDVTVDVFQVGTDTATKTGQFVDPETNKPLLNTGDEIVFVNYVITNNGDDIDLGSSGVTVDARYDDWPYMQGMDSIVDEALFEAQDVNDSAFAPDSYVDPSVYTFASGQQISFGENFAYQAGSPITFEASMTPVDAEGELLHDDGVEGEGAGTIS